MAVCILKAFRNVCRGFAIYVSWGLLKKQALLCGSLMGPMVGNAKWLAGQLSVSDVGLSYGLIRRAITGKGLAATRQAGYSLSRVGL